jgi:DNA-binding LytR/AlgR family response regulator
MPQWQRGHSGVKENAVDVVFLDIEMPGGNGPKSSSAWPVAHADHGICDRA